MLTRAFVALPHLARELLSLSPHVAVAVVLDVYSDGAFVPRPVTRIIDLTDAALRTGAQVGQRVIDAQRFCPTLHIVVITQARLDRELAHIAELLLAHVPQVQILHGGLACDVRLLQSTDAIVAAIKACCARSQHHAVVAVAPSIRLARAATHSGTQQVTDVEAFLRTLPLAHLDLPTHLHDTLSALGTHTVLALKQLLAHGGIARLGEHASTFLTLFDARPEPLQSIVVPSVVQEQQEFDHPVASLEALQFVLKRLCERLCDRVAARREHIVQLTLQLDLEHHNNRAVPKPAPVLVALFFPQPLVDDIAVLHALSARLERVVLAASTVRLTLTATQRTTATAAQLALDPHARKQAQTEAALQRFMLEMQAALGPANSGILRITDSPLPERMSTLVWPPPAPSAPLPAPKRRRRALARHSMQTPHPVTRNGHFVAGWPWPVRVLQRPVRLEVPPVSSQLLGVLEGEAQDTPYARAYAVVLLTDGRRALVLVDDETQDLWLCGWFD